MGCMGKEMQLGPHQVQCTHPQKATSAPMLLFCMSLIVYQSEGWRFNPWPLQSGANGNGLMQDTEPEKKKEEEEEGGGVV